LDVVVLVLEEKVFKGLCGLVEESLVRRGAGTLPALTESALVENLGFEEGRTVRRVKRGVVGRGGCPASPLDGVSEGFHCFFDVSRGFEGDGEL
jgi:hypothetical protein